MKKITEHHLEKVGYKQVEPRPGDPPWVRAKIPVYGCSDCKAIHGKKLKGYHYFIEKSGYEFDGK